MPWVHLGTLHQTPVNSYKTGNHAMKGEGGVPVIHTYMCTYIYACISDDIIWVE